MEVSIDAGRATIVGTETLAGAIASMDQCVRNFRAFTASPTAHVLEAASAHPARALGLACKGRLDFGCDADIVILDDDLYVLGVYVGGECAWSKEGRLSVTENGTRK